MTDQHGTPKPEAADELEASNVDALVMRLREEAQDNPDSLLYRAADELEKRDRLLKFALEGLSSAPHSWGLDITHVQKIHRELSGA